KSSLAAATPRALGLRAHGCRFPCTADRRSVSMNRFFSFRKFAVVLAVLGVLALATPRAAADESFLVDGIFSVTDSHGSDLTVFLEGVFYLDDGAPLHFTIDAHVKHSGNRIGGTPTMVFDDGSTLSLDYEVRLDHNTGIYEGDFLITG